MKTDLIIRKNSKPTVEPGNFSKRGGIDFDKLEATHRNLGVGDNYPEWPEKFDNPAFSREVLGIK